jgi:imidazolonepropionase-like amidohydrolase
MALRPSLTVAVAIPLAVAGAAAQTIDPGKAAGVSPRTDYALTNARIVTAPGKVIEKGTIVIRNGRIAAVGPNVTVPAGVVQMDLAGSSVYPGLIDAATSIGLPSPSRQLATTPAPAAAPAGGRGGFPAGGRGGAGRGAAPPAPAPPVVLPELDASAEAVDMFEPTDEQLKAFRSSGVTTVGLVFNGGIFPGRVGAALTAPSHETNVALRPSVGQIVAFGTKRDGYPRTGIGSVAFIRQAFLDAEYEARLDSAMKKGIPGAPRPSNDPFTRALVPAATNQMPSWFLAEREREMSRVADIATEMMLKGPVVVGAQEGWRAIGNLKRAGATAVVSLQFPTVESITGRAFLAVGNGKTGEAPPPTAADTAEVRGNAAALIKAGIPVALASFGGDGAYNFRDRIRMAMAAGLSADDALKAATVTPAQVLGVSSSVGTIEVGKLANLLVVSGNDLFAAQNPIKQVFIEGRIY